MATRGTEAFDRRSGPGTETLLFGFDAFWYEIDLPHEDADGFRRALAGYIAAAEARPRPRRPRSVPRMTQEQRDELRAWGEVNVDKWAARGIAPMTSGRIPKSLWLAYSRAHGLEQGPSSAGEGGRS